MNIRILKKGLEQRMVKRLIGPFRKRRKWLDKTQWFSKDQLRQIQLEQLRKIVTHSYNTVPYYRKIMDEYGISPADIKTFDDIKAFPLLTKRDVLEAGDSIISRKYPKWSLRAARTGGSTGMPLIIYRNWTSIGDEHAFVCRQWDWAGIGFSDKRAWLMSRVVADPDRKDGRLYAYDPVMKDLILSSHHLSAETAKEFIEVMKKYGVKAVVGYPSSLGLLAKVSLDIGAGLQLKAALTTSEMLSETVKETISKAFGCAVFDFYGSAERVCYIHSCEYGSYHLIPEYGYTELIPSAGSAGKHKVVSTGFWNQATPLIRYDTGDIVTRSEKTCRCGRAFEVIGAIEGRDGDVIKTPSGRRLGVTLIIQVLYVICGTTGIVESQIVQDRIDHLTIKYVPLDGFDKKTLGQFISLVRRYLPNELKLDFARVDRIERTADGKLRPLVSLIG